MIGTHYRQKLNFSFTAIVGAESSLKRLQNTIERLKSHAGWQADDLERALAAASDSHPLSPDAEPEDPAAIPADASDRAIRRARAFSFARLTTT